MWQELPDFPPPGQEAAVAAGHSCSGLLEAGVGGAMRSSSSTHLGRGFQVLGLLLIDQSPFGSSSEDIVNFTGSGTGLSR